MIGWYGLVDWVLGIVVWVGALITYLATKRTSPLPYACGQMGHETFTNNPCLYFILSYPWTSIGATEANVVQQLTAHLRQATAAQHWLLWPKCSSMLIKGDVIPIFSGVGT